MDKMYFFFLIVATISICICRSCPPFLSEECDLSLYPEDFPNTVEELRDTCRSSKTLLNCIVNAQENYPCDSNITAEMKKLLNYIEEVCDEDSPEFIAISGNLDCILPIARTMPDACRGSSFSEKVRETVVEGMENFAENSNLSTEEHEECFEHYWRITCPAILIGLECGDDAGNAVSGLLENTDYHIRHCPKQFLEETRPLKEIFKAAIIEERKVENAIRKRK